MTVNLSAAQLGVIVHAIERQYDGSSEAARLADELNNLVYEFLGDEFYQCWLDEFDINFDITQFR